MMNEITRIIRENPECYIYYTDNGSWAIYVNKEAFDKLETISEEEYDQYLEDIVIYEGDDFSGADGYAPDLVVALAEALGIQVGSV